MRTPYLTPRHRDVKKYWKPRRAVDSLGLLTALRLWGSRNSHAEGNAEQGAGTVARGGGDARRNTARAAPSGRGAQLARRGGGAPRTACGPVSGAGRASIDAWPLFPAFCSSSSSRCDFASAWGGREEGAGAQQPPAPAPKKLDLILPAQQPRSKDRARRARRQQVAARGASRSAPAPEAELLPYDEADIADV